MAHSYKHPRPAVAVDNVVFGLDDEDLKVLLIQRGIEPFKDAWAFPGGFVHLDETLEEAARRELQEEAGITNVYLEQLYTFGGIDRDPRERVIAIAYYGLVKLSDHRVQAATDAKNAAWFSVSKVPDLAFDHTEILKTAHERLKGKIRYHPIGFELLPNKFPLRSLQQMYEIILSCDLDKRNFRKKILNLDLLIELDELETEVSHRAARLYRFNKKSYNWFKKQGFNFDLLSGTIVGKE